MPILTRLRKLLDGRFDRSRWVDVPPNTVSVGVGSAALTRKAIRSGAPQYDHFVSNQTDTLIFSFQSKHNWDYSAVRPHVHTIPTSAAGGLPSLVLGNVYWQFRWAWTGAGSGLKIPLGASWQEAFLTMPVTVADQFEELVIGPLIVPPPNLPLSAHLHVEMSRLGANALDTYVAAAESGLASANLALCSVDCHARLNKTGSLAEWSDV